MIYKIKHKYKGWFDPKQIDYYKTTLKKKLIWILRYNDPETKDLYPNVNTEQYFLSVMKELNGLNSLLSHPYSIPHIMTLLEAAKKELDIENYNWSTVRSFVLDAHALIDNIGQEEIL